MGGPVNPYFHAAPFGFSTAVLARQARALEGGPDSGIKDLGRMVDIHGVRVFKSSRF